MTSPARATTDTAEDDAAMASTHGSRIIAALEDAWQAIRDHHPQVPAVVLITGSGAHQKGTPEGYKLRGHHWPERWIHGTQRAPELFIAGELLGLGGRAVLEVMLHEAAHALATVRRIKDTSAEGNRYHNKRFVTLAEELGLAGPAATDKVTGWSDCKITDPTAAAYATVIGAIDSARLPYLADLAGLGDGQDGGGTGEGEDKTGDKPKTRRGGQRRAAECACDPPRRIQLTPKQLEAGPVICGVCGERFEPPEPAGDEHQDHDET